MLLRLEKGGKGKTVYAVGGDIEFIALNFTDPNTEVDGERSSMKTKHPILSDPAVRKALSLLVDRDAVKKAIYGRAGRTTANLPQWARAVRLQEHHVGVQRREGRQAAGRGRLEAGRGRHPREGRQEAEAALPDLDQRSAPEDPGHRQAGLPEGRHRRRTEIGRRLGVLLLRRRQSRHLCQVLRRHRDVPDPDDPARSGAADAPLSFAQRRHQGEQVAGHEFPALGQQGLRRGDRCGRRARSIRSSARRSTSSATTCMWQDTVFIPVHASPQGGRHLQQRCAR